MGAPPLAFRFGEYRLDGVAGPGSLGTVYRAVDARSQRVAALRLLGREDLRDADARARVLHDTRAVAELRHPGLVEVLEAGELESTLFIATAWLEGPDLAAVLAAGERPAPAHVVRLVAPVAEALELAHARGLVHGAVRPSNIRLREDGEAVLCDFGLGTPLDAAAGLARPETVAYAAPEQVRGGPVGTRTDVYALAAVIHALFTGTPPFPRRTAMASMWAVEHEPPPAPSALREELPAALDRALARGLAKAPGERPASPVALVESVRRALGLPQPGAEPLGPAPKLSAAPPAAPAAPRSRHRLRRAALLLLVLVAIAVPVALALTGSEEARTVRVADTPTGLATGGDALWVAHPRPRVVARRDPVSGEPAGRALRVGNGPARVALGGRVLWVADTRTAALVPVDLAAGRPAPPIPVGGEIGDLAVAAGAAWTTDGAGGTVRVVQEGAREAGTVRVGVNPVGLGGDGDWIVVANAGDGTVTRIDARRRRVAGAPVRTGRQPVDVAVAGRLAWVADGADGTVVRMDVRTGERRDPPIDVGGVPSAIVADDRDVFVASAVERTVRRIDPDTGDVGPPRAVGREPAALALTDDHLWVANAADDTLTRLAR